MKKRGRMTYRERLKVILAKVPRGKTFTLDQIQNGDSPRRYNATRKEITRYLMGQKGVLRVGPGLYRKQGRS
jgi:hypothetical protein